MTSFRIGNLSVTTEKKGRKKSIKSSSPNRFGVYSEIRTRDYEFQFNLNGEIKSIRGLSMNWPHPAEILKRTDGNDWIYHSVGAAVGYQKIKDCIGEYYLPCPAYPTNAVWAFSPYSDPNVAQGIGAWYELFGTLHELDRQKIPKSADGFIDRILYSNDDILHRRSEALYEIIGSKISVLPPDTRHVDYEVIPLIIADGCRYNCGFCEVKTNRPFQTRTPENITEQLKNLKSHYGADICNYNGLYLGNHDALGADEKLLGWSATEAFSELGLNCGLDSRPKLFLFGSVDSLLDADSSMFATLNELPFKSYINIGFESVDAQTLRDLKKPIGIEKVETAFRKMLSVNRVFENLEVTGNFLLGDSLSSEHNRSLGELLQQVPENDGSKGTIYLSPLMNSHRSTSLLPLFFEIKNRSRLPTYLYLIQRM